MRGTLRQQSSERGLHRFIPAHAGNTHDREVRRDAGTVHPRACGEHASLSTSSTGADGSSPRMRGTLHAARPRGGKTRFIPAHAGNTCLLVRNMATEAVHPRACGEHSCWKPMNPLNNFPMGLSTAFPALECRPVRSTRHVRQGRPAGLQLAERWTFPGGEIPSSRLKPASLS